MEEEVSKTIPFFEELERVVSIRLEILKLKLISKVSDMLAAFFSNFILILSLVLFLVFLSVGLALMIGEWLGKSSYGFLCIAALFGLIWVFIYFFRWNMLKRKIADGIVAQIFEHDEA